MTKCSNGFGGRRMPRAVGTIKPRSTRRFDFSFESSRSLSRPSCGASYERNFVERREIARARHDVGQVLANHLVNRDHLRANPSDAHAYGELKNAWRASLPTMSM